MVSHPTGILNVKGYTWIPGPTTLLSEEGKRGRKNASEPVCFTGEVWSLLSV